jgi:hypothetical protein
MSWIEDKKGNRFRLEAQTDGWYLNGERVCTVYGEILDTQHYKRAFIISG